MSFTLFLEFTDGSDETLSFASYAARSERIRQAKADHRVKAWFAYDNGAFSSAWSRSGR